MKKEVKKIAIKVVKTMAETALGLLGTATFIQEVSWAQIASAVALSGVATILFNLKELKAED